MVKLHQSKTEAVHELRKLILHKIDRGEDQSVDGFHYDDIERINNDIWLSNFLDFHDYKVREALKQCWDTLEWRKKLGVNEICESSVPTDYLTDGNIYIRGYDNDGKIIMFFRIREYIRGVKTIENLRTYFLYWVERGQRESKGDKVTIVFDMLDTGMRNIDLELTRLMVTILKNYYPSSLNYLLIYDMPWIMNGFFQIIKTILPKKVIERLKFINQKNMRQYIPEEYIPIEWGGMDKYELKFEPEVVIDHNNNSNNENINSSSDKRIASRLNNYSSCINLSQSKVHFAAQSESPMSDISSSSYDNQQNHYGDMLQLSPAETIMFQKNSSNEFAGNVEILNISKKAITYKVKTTAPDKFRVRPSSGTLSPNNSATINVVIQKGQHTLPVNKDKFLVMCMALDGESQTNDEIATMWKEVTASSPDVEQHRLKCAMPANVTTAIINSNIDAISDYFLDGTSSTMSASNIVHSSTQHHNGTKQVASSHSQQQHLQITVDRLSDCVNHMQQQVKSLQSLQWITIFVFIMLSIAIVYILKMEIQNSNSQYCIDK